MCFRFHKFDRNLRQFELCRSDFQKGGDLKLRRLLNEISSKLGLSLDILLTRVRETFYEDAFARKNNLEDFKQH